MLGVALHLFAIAAAQAFVAAVVTGLGLGVRRMFGAPLASVRDLLVAFWVGLAATFLLALAWNFAFPINDIPLLLVAGGGIVGLFASRRELAAIPIQEPWCRSRVLGVIVLLAWLWVANQSRGPITNSDTGLYHWQAILWAEQYPAVPGLANLFGPLGFNNGSLLWDALIDAGPFRGQAGHLANATLVQMLVLLGIAGLARARQVEGRDRSQALFDGVCLLPAVAWALEDWITSFATDVSTGGALLIAGVELHALLLAATDPPPSSARTPGYRLVTIGALVTLAVCFKVSSAVFAATALALAVVVYLVRYRSAQPRGRTFGWLAVAVAGVGGLWAVRGTVLSGYPLFPGPWLPMPVEWRVPAAHAAGEFGFAAHSSRASTENPAVIVDGAGVVAWFPEWWRDSATAEIFLIVVPAALTLAVGLAWIGLRLSGARGRDPTPQTWLLLLPLLGSLLVWFLVAPEPRYVSALVWLVLAATSLGAFRIAPNADAPEAARTIIIGVVLLAASQLVLDPLLSPLRTDLDQPLVTRVLRRNLRFPTEVAWPDRKIRNPGVRQYRTSTGLVLNVPADRCWTTALPCTPNPAPNLRLRVAGRIDRGFVVDGPWQMEDWPANRPEFARLWSAATRRADSLKAGGR